MADIRMDEARYVRGEGEEIIVTLPDAPARPDAVRYDAADHVLRLKEKFAMACRYCNAGVHFHKGSKAICGDNLQGPRAHFHTNPGQRHDADCQWPERAAQEARGQGTGRYDRTRGYKIHLNTTGLAARFNRDAGAVYDRDAERKIVTLHSALAGREPRSIASLADLIDLMRKADTARLRDSVVVHHTHVLPWDDFLVRYNRKAGGAQARFASLVGRLERVKIQPCVMEFNLASGTWPRNSFGGRADSVPVYLGRSADGRPEYVRPRAWLDNPRDSHVSHGMAEAGRYLVMGYARLKTVRSAGAINHYLNISVTDRKQLQKLDIATLAPKQVF